MTNSDPTAVRRIEAPTQRAQNAATTSLVGASENAEVVASKMNDQGNEVYPSGLPLLFIVLALIFSIFLASLDLVCKTNGPSVP